MTSNPTTHNIRSSIEGKLLGLDDSNAPASQVGGGTNPLGRYSPFLTGDGFQGMRIFPIGSFGKDGTDYKEGTRISRCEVFDDFLGVEISPVLWNALKGSDSTPVAPAIAVAVNGTIRLTSGSDATSTMATNGSQLTGPLTNLVSNGETRFEARIGNLSAATHNSICFGLVDVSTISAPFTLSTATVTANGTNGAAFLQDSRGTNTKLNAVSVNAGGTPQVAALANIVNVTSNAYDIYRIEIDAAGNAKFFINGVLVATQLLAVATTAVLCASIGIFCSTAQAETLDVDYLLVQQVRV